MKGLLAAVLLFTSTSVFAATGNVLFNGTVASACSFTSASAGSLTISGTSISSGSNGTIDVTNNDPATFTLSITSTTLTTSPDGQTLSAITTTPTVTGANAGITLPSALANAGTDTVSIALTGGTMSATETAGNYVVTVVVDCS